MNPLKTFTYKDELYIRVIPSKRLFNSTMVHEVVNREDIFAVRVTDSSLTVIPGISQVEHSTHILTLEIPNVRPASFSDSYQTPAAGNSSKAASEARQHLRELANKL